MPSYGDVAQLVADPIVQTGTLAALGTVSTRLALRKRSERQLVGQLALFAALTALLVSQDIVPYAPGPQDTSGLLRFFLGLAKIAWWTSAAWSLISLVRVFVIFEGRVREGRFLQDLVVGIIYVGAVLSVVTYVFNAPVGTLIATSGAIAVILGLALQSTLSDVFSGIALNLARPYGIGDWLVLGNAMEGKVVETNWRATHLLTGANDLVIIPNSDLAKARLTNLSTPEPSHGVTLTIRLRPTTAPSAMIELMHSVLLSSTSTLRTPEPSVHVASLDANAVELEVTFRVADVSLVGVAKTEIFDLTYRHAKAAGMALAQPPDGGVVTVAAPASGTLSAGLRATQMRLLDAVPLFAHLTEDEKEALASTMTRRTFRKGDVFVEQGSVLKCLMIVRSGVAVVTRRREGVTGETAELARLAPGDFFGEGGLLTGAGEPGSVTALTPVVVYEITQEGLAPLMRDRPAIADELGSLLSRRTVAEQSRLDERRGSVLPKSYPGLTTHIRHLFHL
ncbi:mechanosensitive ion channel family protein [Mesorhizobium sp. STM 4661]|uniref:cyclic nucleotide-binding domain-containing protein n=1 Tax=Mesorhizobium sp. STM 4661 TaxID=1297570 RepID=UPI0002BDBF38|nr:mechanosensitive ion channel family protein [Mesorhizobium sp. STM 4661]CCV15527.1 Cyclic nucleotide-regulated small mechanosensitive ion channel [Mesorhizobium sp. STM 4661]